MASSNLSLEFRIHWAELRFPPLNLWVMPSLSSGSMPSNGNTVDTQQKPISAPINSSRALHKLHRQLATLLAVRGGKNEH